MEIRLNTCTELIKKDNGGIIVINSSLPKFLGDSLAEKKINAFYSRLKEIHKNAASAAFEGEQPYGLSRLYISTDCNVTDGIVHVVRRYSFEKNGKNVAVMCVDDFFSGSDGNMIKKSKNGKKQTFLPSRKTKFSKFCLSKKNSKAQRHTKQL